MRRATLPLCCAVLLGPVHSEYFPRGLLAPSAAEPAAVVAGEKLSMLVRVASGLTPPPGVQTERALRGFAARLCALDACIAVPVRNVRPLDAHSFVYRVEAPLPPTMAAGLYDLELRYPGGSARPAKAVRVLAGSATKPRGASEPAASHPRSGCSLTPGRPLPRVRGLLALGLSWKLATRRRRRSRAGNTHSRTSVSDWS